MEKTIPAYPYIRQIVKHGNLGLSEAELRRMLAKGELPGFYSGPQQKYFRVDYQALVKMLSEKSRPSAS